MAWIIFGVIGLVLLGIWAYLMLISSKKGSGNIKEYIDQTPESFNPNANRFAKNHIIKTSAKDTEVAAALTEKMQALLVMMQAQTGAIVEEFNQQAAQMRAMMQLGQEMSTHRLTILTHERDMALIDNERAVIAEANRLGLPVSAMNELKLEEGKMKMRLFEVEQSARAELTAADFSDLAPYQQIEILTQRLENLRRQRYELSIGYDPPEVKGPLLSRYDKNIKALEQDINGRQKRLVQAQKG